MHPALLAVFALTVTDAPAAAAPPPPMAKLSFGPEHSDTWGALIRLDGRVKKMADAYGKLVPLDETLPIKFEECGDVNAYYFYEPRKVVVCYEFMDYIYEQFASIAPTPEYAIEATIAATVAVVAHELGHATVDILNLPVIARQEDIADSFGAWYTFALLKDTAPTIALAQFWRIYSLSADSDPSDEHSPALVRHYNGLCWAFGADPSQGWLLGRLGDRAYSCEMEFAEMEAGWLESLGLGF